MLVLFETPAGYSVFKVSDPKRFSKTSEEDIHDTFFSDSETAGRSLELVSFRPFEDTADAVSAAAACVEGKMSKSLKSFLKRQVGKRSSSDKESLAVADRVLAGAIKEKLGSSLRCDVVSDGKTQELFRGVREHMDELMERGGGVDGGKKTKGVSASDLRAMRLGLSHSLSRYKLKFSADKVDTMVIQAVGLLDELDKEINTYAMRVKEWYGWHFPELQAILNELGDSNATYSKTVVTCGMRTSYKTSDLSSVLENESVEKAVKDAAEVSMGTEISDQDLENIQALASQVLSMTEYRAQLFAYLKHRMNAIAPNLTILVGELVGARLVAHAGSLINLAKQPASTVQILGAEKALFRALKTKHDTPKYGLIYHASLVGQAPPKHKGKMARVLAAKAALGARVDALADGEGDDDTIDATLGYESRAKVEARLRQWESGGAATTPGAKAAGATRTARYDPAAAAAANGKPRYDDSADMVLDDVVEKETPKKKKKKDKKRKADEAVGENGGDDDDEAKRSAKKAAKKAKKARKSKG